MRRRAGVSEHLPAAGAFEGREHVLPVRVYYEDTDLTGVVYHANYLRFFERGRSDFLRLAGVDHQSLLERCPTRAFAVTRITVDFRRPRRASTTPWRCAPFRARGASACTSPSVSCEKGGWSPRPRWRSFASTRQGP